MLSTIDSYICSKLMQFRNKLDEDTLKEIRPCLMGFLGLSAVAPVRADVFDTIQSKLKAIYPKIRSIGLIIGGIAFAIAGIAWFVSQDPQTARTAKSWMIRVAIGTAIVVLGPWLLIQGIELFGTEAKSKTIDDLTDYVK